MSAFKPTPGEFRAVIYGGWDSPRVWSETGSLALLQHQESGFAEAESNARLFAASPKLLAALSRLSDAALARDATMGDPIRLLQVRAELADANRQAMAVLSALTGGAA